MTSPNFGGSDPERDLADLLPLLRSLDDQSGPDPVFVDRLQQRLLRQHAGAAASRALGPSPLPTPGFPVQHQVEAPRAPARRGLGVAIGLLVVAVLVFTVLAGSPAVLRLMAPEVPVGTLPEAGITGGIAGRATPTAAELGTAMERGNAGRTGEIAGGGPVDRPDVRWRVPVLDSHYFSPRAMVATGGSIFTSGWGTPSGNSTATQSGYAFAFDADSGEERWRFRSKGPEDATDVSAPVVADGIVYVAFSNYRPVEVALPECLEYPCDESLLPMPDRYETGYVVAFDAATGEERWRTSMKVAVSVSPVVADGTLYVGRGEGGLLALDARTGRQRWGWEMERNDAGNGERWVGVPAVSDGVVYVVGGDSHLERVTLYALDGRNGTELWTVAAPGVTLSDPAVGGDMLFVNTRIWDPTMNGGGERTTDRAPRNRAVFTARGKDTGAERWRYNGGGDAIVADGTVILVENGQDAPSIVALEAATGRHLWSAAGAGIDGWWPTIAYANGTAYQDIWWDPLSLPEPLRSAAGLVGISSKGGIRALDASTGAEQWRFEEESDGGITTAVGNDAVYLLNVGEDSFLTALDDGS